jgi:hypothetical protein
MSEQTWYYVTRWSIEPVTVIRETEKFVYVKSSAWGPKRWAKTAKNCFSAYRTTYEGALKALQTHIQKELETAQEVVKRKEADLRAATELLDKEPGAYRIG